MKDEDIQALERLSKTRVYKKDEIVIKGGEKNTSLFHIIKGMSIALLYRIENE